MTQAEVGVFWQVSLAPKWYRSQPEFSLCLLQIHPKRPVGSIRDVTRRNVAAIGWHHYQGIEPTVALARPYRPESGPNGPSWLTFLGHSKDSLWSVDFFRCESLILKSHWVMVVMDQFSRRIVGFAVHAGALDGPAVCRMFNRIVSGSGAPRYLSSDNDPLFLFHQWQANLRILDVMEVKTVPYVPLSHPFIERLIGTVRREYLDQVPFWSVRDLERKLMSFQDYYNKDRVHRGLDGAPPNEQSKITDRKIARLDDYRWEQRCRGLYQLPVAA